MENLETGLTDELIASSPDAATYIARIYMMRRMNFIRLVDEKNLRGTVAYAMGIKSASWFSQLLNDRVAFNEKTARRIEAAVGMPFGTLDKRSW
jgi:hypothetical protein